MWPGNRPADIQPRTPQPLLRKDDNGKLPIWRLLFVIVGTLSGELMGTIRETSALSKRLGTASFYDRKLKLETKQRTIGMAKSTSHDEFLRRCAWPQLDESDVEM